MKSSVALTLLSNNAGYADTSSVEDVDIADFQAQIETNFYGTVYVSKAVILSSANKVLAISFKSPLLVEGSRTRDLLLTRAPSTLLVDFQVSLVREVAPLGVKVTVLEPGAMATDWAGSSMKSPRSVNHIGRPSASSLSS